MVVELKDIKEWWTWAGERANATLAAAMPDLVDADDLDNRYVRLRDDVPAEPFYTARKRAHEVDLPAPTVTDEALQQLKFSEMLPPGLARRTLAARLTDAHAASRVLMNAATWHRSTETAEAR